MNCAICGKDNQAGTRFCVHCGAALTVPSAGTAQQSTIAAAGAILGPKPPPASSAAPSAPAPPTATVPVYTPRPAYLPPAADVESIPPEVQSASPTVPAYNADPKKAGFVLVVIGIVGLLAVGAYLGWQFFGGPTEIKDTLTRIEAPPRSQSSSPPAPSASSATPPIAAETAKGSDEKSAPPIADEAKSSVAPAEEAKSTSAATPKGESKAASKAATSRPPAVPAIATPGAPAAPPQTAAQPVAPATALATAPSPAVDRWAQFAEELHRCQAEAFLSRVVCDQRVRIRYCDGYWGKVAQCPGAIANPDRGQ